MDKTDYVTPCAHVHGIIITPYNCHDDKPSESKFKVPSVPSYMCVWKQEVCDDHTLQH